MYSSFNYDNNNVMNDLFALNLTIRLLMLGLGSAMFIGSLLAYINRNKNEKDIYIIRTLVLGFIGFVITFWVIASLLNK